MPYLHRQKQSRIILLSAITLLILVGLYFYFYNRSNADIIRSGFAPTVITITPVENATVSGVVSVQVSATAPTNTTWIRTLSLYDGGTLIKTIYGGRTTKTLNYTFLWDTTKTTYKDWNTTKPGEQRLLNAMATDGNGKRGIDRTYVTLVR